MIYGDILKGHPTSVHETLQAINEEYISFQATAKGPDSKEMYFMVGANDTHNMSPRYKAAGDKRLFNTRNCYEIDYKDDDIHHNDSSSPQQAKLTDLGVISSEAFGRRYYLPLDINAKYPNDFGTKELAKAIKKDLKKFERKGKPISGRVRCEYNPDAPSGSQYSFIEMNDDEQYEDYMDPKYGYTDS